jgi:hypothetical protein
MTAFCRSCLSAVDQQLLSGPNMQTVARDHRSHPQDANSSGWYLSQHDTWMIVDVDADWLGLCRPRQMAHCLEQHLGVHELHADSTPASSLGSRRPSAQRRDDPGLATGCANTWNDARCKTAYLMVVHDPHRDVGADIIVMRQEEDLFVEHTLVPGRFLC